MTPNEYQRQVDRECAFDDAVQREFERVRHLVPTVESDTELWDWIYAEIASPYRDAVVERLEDASLIVFCE